MTKKKNEKNCSSEQLCNRPDCRKMRKALARHTKTGTGKEPKQRYFDEAWLAERLGLARKTIQNMRYAGVGPQPVMTGKNGGAVRYYIRDILAYERSLRDPSQPYHWR